jgi:polysaccharide export outer membrane protein
MNGMLAVIVRRKWRRYGLLVCLAALPAACAAPAPSLVGVKTARTGEYIIGPGDDLNVFVYRSPELSALVPVRPDGLISTPLAPDVVAAGRTPTQLAHALEARLRQYVKEPNVTVMVTGFVGPPDRQIRVIGQVVQPLAMPYRKGLSILDVMIAAKGLTPFAAGNRALIVRREPAGPQTFNVRLGDLLNDGEISQNVMMQPGDTVFVPEAWF